MTPDDIDHAIARHARRLAREIAAARPRRSTVDRTRTLPLAPVVRADCQEGGPMYQRPCTWSSCRHHLNGSCVLDLVDARGPLSLREIGRVFGVSRERARQLEARALRKLAIAFAAEAQP